MRITWLLEDASQLWGGVKVALEDANWLHRRGHQVTVVSRSAAPDWMEVECAFRTVPDFQNDNLPDADVLVATYWKTLPWAASASRDKGTPVHFCQGYDGDAPENAPLRDRIEAAFRLPGIRHITVSSNLTRILRERFGVEARQVVYAIDHTIHHPEPEHSENSPLRIGLVGPYQLRWKGLPTGYEACRLAHAAGQPLVLVRATNLPPCRSEREAPFPIEWHVQLRPDQMGDYYRSLDVFLGTSTGPEEGFFLPAVEAMACGVPSVLTDVPCFRAHREAGGNDDYALFVPPNDPAAMAEALIVAGRMAEVRSQLRAGGLEVAARYTLDRHGEDLETALRSAAQGQGDDTTMPTHVMPTIPPVTASDQGESDISELREHLRNEIARAEGEGRSEQASHLRAAETVLATGAHTAESFNRLGVVLYQAGDTTGAQRSFERALALEPGNGDAVANLAAVQTA